MLTRREADLMAENERLRQRVAELSEGACRFNCRTAKSAFQAGWTMYADNGLQSRCADEMDKAWGHYVRQR